jgi:hypothetical protein
MDTWNPILAETHVKRVPWWQAFALEAAFVVALVFGAWAFAVFILSLERV